MSNIIIGTKPIIKDNLVLYMDASNRRSHMPGNMTWHDLTGSGIFSTPPTITTLGPHTIHTGESFRFDGSADPDGLFLGNIDSNQRGGESITDRTYECWVKPLNTGSGVMFRFIQNVGCGLACNGGFMIRSGKLTFNWWDNTAYQYLDNATTAEINTWYHLVASVPFSIDGIPRLYINGQLAAQYTEATFIDYNGGMNYLEIGGQGARNNYYYNGEVGIIRYYFGTALDAGQVLHNFEAQKRKFGL